MAINDTQYSAIIRTNVINLTSLAQHDLDMFYTRFGIKPDSVITSNATYKPIMMYVVEDMFYKSDPILGGGAFVKPTAETQKPVIYGCSNPQAGAKPMATGWYVTTTGSTVRCIIVNIPYFSGNMNLFEDYFRAHMVQWYAQYRGFEGDVGNITDLGMENFHQMMALQITRNTNTGWLRQKTNGKWYLQYTHYNKASAEPAFNSLNVDFPAIQFMYTVDAVANAICTAYVNKLLVANYKSSLPGNYYTAFGDVEIAKYMRTDLSNNTHTVDIANTHRIAHDDFYFKPILKWILQQTFAVTAVFGSYPYTKKPTLAQRFMFLNADGGSGGYWGVYTVYNGKYANIAAAQAAGASSFTVPAIIMPKIYSDSHLDWAEDALRHEIGHWIGDYAGSASKLTGDGYEWLSSMFGMKVAWNTVSGAEWKIKDSSKPHHVTTNPYRFWYKRYGQSTAWVQNGATESMALLALTSNIPAGIAPQYSANTSNKYISAYTNGTIQTYKAGGADAGILPTTFFK